MKDESTSLGSRVASGVFWTVAMRMSIRGLGLISVIVLARLLVPEDFGIVAKASMIASFLEVLATFGLQAALIQNQRAVADHYDTVFTIHVIRGLIIALILCALAFPSSDFFQEPALAQIMWFYALAAFLNGFINVGTVDFRKNLDFDLDFRFSIYQKLAGFVITIIVAYVWRSYWAFVFGVLATSLVGVWASYALSAYRPSFTLSQWRSLFEFSKWIFFVGIVNSIARKLDTFILSRYSTTEIVGRYTVAYEVAGSASTEIAMPIARATMSGLAKLNESPADFRDMYQRTIAITLLVAVPAALGLSAVAQPLTDIVLGAKWREAGQLIEILAIFGIFRAISAISASAFQASGEVRAFGKLWFIHLFVQLICLPIGFAVDGVVGLAKGLLFAGAIQVMISATIQHSLGFFVISSVVKDIWRLVVAGLTMYATIVFVLPQTGWLHGFGTGLTLFLEVSVGVLTYSSVLGLLWWMAGSGSGPERVIWGFLRDRFDRSSTSS